MPIRTILVGVDDSAGSRAALDFTCELAAALGARVVAVNVFEPLAHLEELEPGRDLRSLRDAAEALLAGELCRGLVERGLAHETRVREGEPASALADEARAVGADLVVVGARRQGWLRGWVLGSTSRKLLELSPAPVTVVHPPVAPAAETAEP